MVETADRPTSKRSTALWLATAAMAAALAWIAVDLCGPQSAVDLERALADSPAEVYGVPVERLMEHARLRAEAMITRDAKSEAGGLAEEDWAKIEELLISSWQLLWKAVNAPSAPALSSAFLSPPHSSGIDRGAQTA